MKKYIPILQEYVRGARLEFEQLLDQDGVLVVVLANAYGNRIAVTFDSYFAYRKIDEGDALLTLSAMRDSGGTTLCLYRVEGSDFLSWFSAERCDQAQNKALTHYMIGATNDIIDVLSMDPPIVENR